MNPDIQAIFIDLGNTLRILIEDEDHMALARRKLVELTGVSAAPQAFYAELDARYKVYRKWAFEQMVEAPEVELWARWLLPEAPAEKIIPLAVELTYQFRQAMGRRVVVERGKEVVQELYRRGYTLGIISNVITSREIPDWMEADGFTPYFKSVVLSSVFGKRKPDPAIYHEAARLAGVEPARCAYIADNPKRDVVGTRQAGFGMIVLMLQPEKMSELENPAYRPDLVITQFAELLDYFPERQPQAVS